MKKPFHCFSCLFVLALILFSQVSMANDFDNSSIVIEEASDSWLTSGDLNDDIDDYISSIVAVPVIVCFNVTAPTQRPTLIYGLSFQPEARAPPYV